MIYKKPITRFTVALYVGILGLIIAALHQSAITFYLYWELLWFDMVMHFLGGAWVALLGFWLVLSFIRHPSFSKAQIFIITISSVLIIGILWEIFEYFTGLSFIFRDFWIDTLSDLTMDLLGSIVIGWWLSLHFVSRLRMPQE